jgi:multicomponent Na+:H+ antiporter subunit B
MIGEYAGQVVRVVCVLMAPLIMLFGFYVIAHGHYGPGGGFAGGIVVGVGVILLRISVDTTLCRRCLPPSLGPLGAGTGVLLYLVAGALPMLAGGAYLDYAAVSVGGMPDDQLRYLGIFVIEIAVGLAVTGVMLMLFDTLAGATQDVSAEVHRTDGATAEHGEPR